MQQIRIAGVDGLSHGEGRRFVCEWMEGCSMNQWFLKSRLAEALAVHGPGSHWMEKRAMERSQQVATA